MRGNSSSSISEMLVDQRACLYFSDFKTDWPIGPRHMSEANIQSSLVFLCRTPSRRAHIRSSHPSLGGASGMKSQSAPDASADTKARYLEQQHRVIV